MLRLRPMNMTDGERAERAQRIRAEEVRVVALREKYVQWHIFRIAGGWGAVLKDMETAATGNTPDELAAKLAEYTT